jgi:hypothetical protein
LVWIAMLALLAALLFVGWLLLPWRRIDGLHVRTAEIVSASSADIAAQRVVIEFSTDADLRNVLTRYGAGFVTARLFACDDTDRGTRIVVVQRGGYLVDEGRVRALPAVGGQPRYRAVFGNRFQATVDHRIVSTPALVPTVPLCFTLEGGGMFMGRIRAETVPLAPFLRRSA